MLCISKPGIMSEIIEFLFSQYSSYTDSFIFLEFFAVSMNIISVIYAKQNNILVYPTGLIGTGIFVYVLFKFSLRRYDNKCLLLYNVNLRVVLLDQKKR